MGALVESKINLILDPYIELTIDDIREIRKICSYTGPIPNSVIILDKYSNYIKLHKSDYQK